MDAARSLPVPSTAPHLPRLLPVPNVMHELTIKATLSGITVLNDGRFKKRYTGNKYSQVDINGYLWLRSADLKKHLQGDQSGKGKKKRPGLPSVPLTENIECPQNSEPGPDLQKNLVAREYRVNKVEVRQRLLGMIRTRKGRKELYFWTVSFPKGIADDLAYQAFNTWLTTLRQKKWLRDYIWIAERQQNGTVHFHIGIPHKMSVVAANRMMRTTLTTFAKRGLLPVSVYAIKRYNGVDIAKNRKTGRVTNFAIKKGARSLAHYLTKYVTKNDTPFSHLAWHNSRGYSALFTGVTFTVAEFLKLDWKKYVLPRSVVSNEFFKFFPWLNDPPDLLLDHLAALNNFLQDELEKQRA